MVHAQFNGHEPEMNPTTLLGFFMPIENKIDRHLRNQNECSQKLTGGGSCLSWLLHVQGCKSKVHAAKIIKIKLRSWMKRSITAIFILLVMPPSFAKPLLIEGNLDHWRPVTLNGETQYQPIMDMEQGVVLRAESVKSASGYEYSRTINLNKTPVLQWQWTAELTPYALAIDHQGIETKQNEFDERDAKGNDFVLRVVVSRKPMFAQAKSIHYVWSHSQPIESDWAIDDNNKVIVVSGDGQTTMKWQTLHRHIQKDWQRVFAENISDINSIMFMTDSDAIGGHAIGYYGDMRTLATKAMAKSEP